MKFEPGIHISRKGGNRNHNNTWEIFLDQEFGDMGN